jgi:hypothetical protein
LRRPAGYRPAPIAFSLVRRAALQNDDPGPISNVPPSPASETDAAYGLSFSLSSFIGPAAPIARGILPRKRPVRRPRNHMNINVAATKRPKLHWPKALLSNGLEDRLEYRNRSFAPTLSAIELRRIVAEMTG